MTRNVKEIEINRYHYGDKDIEFISDVISDYLKEQDIYVESFSWKIIAYVNTPESKGRSSQA